MAWKTPGVYFTEIDNTEFQNPAAEINTTVAVIGFAKKGPIGVPTEITTYNDYKTTFGTPISGQMAGLAIRNILTAGGTVLFTRVADTTIASKSNVILKNGSDAVDGQLVVNKTTDITTDTDGYELSSVYAGTLNGASGQKKTIIVRTPAEGKLKLSTMFSQFSDSLKDCSGYDEFKVSKTIKNSSVRNFNISVIDEDSSTYENIGPFFVSVAGKDSSSGAISNVVSNISSIFEDSVKTNAYQKLYVLGTAKNEGLIDWATTEEDENVNVDSVNPSSFKMYLGTEETKILQFTLTTVADGVTKSTKKRVEFEGEADSASGGYYISMEEVASTLTEALKNEKIYVKWCFQNTKAKIKDSKYDNGNSAPYLLFVALDKTMTSVDVNPYIDGTDGKTVVANSLFVPVNPVNPSDASTNSTQAYYYNDSESIDPSLTGYLTLDGTNETYEASDSEDANAIVGLSETIIYTDGTTGSGASTFAGLFCAKQKCNEVVDYGENLINVEYDSKTISIRFQASDKFNVANSEVTVSKTEFGGFLFEDEDIETAYEANKTNEDLLYLKNEDDMAIGSHLASFVGEVAVDSSSADVTPISVSLVDGQIVISEEGNTIPGEFDTTSPIKGYNDLSVLIGEQISESTYDKNGYTSSDACVIAKEGTAEVEEDKQDMVIFTAREYGEGTSDIGVKVYTSVSPIDKSKTHYISVLVNGNIKETWEDVSYDPSAENYFADLINEEPENDGSEYIKVTVVKQDETSTEVNLEDTEMYTGSSDTPVYLGKALTEDSINRVDAGARYSEYTKYDYAIGNNGIPEDSTDLFVDAMNTTDSGLCNKDLYLWHILITPDNITEEVQDAAINLVEFMEDAIYIADPPQGLSREGVIQWHNGKLKGGRSSAFESNYACTYWPWLKLYDSTSAKYVWAMPSVVMAAQFCKVDNNYAPWYAPAGETNGLITSALDMECYPNKNDRDNLYLDQNRVNPFLMLKNGNILAYGEKTFQRKNSTLTKIHTRRMLVALKHDLRNSIKHFLFLPTMSENIAKIRGIVTSIMEEVKIGGGVVSYNVVCDETNNTTETLQQDILNVAVSCVPTGCIEQVEITFTLNKSSESVS